MNFSSSLILTAKGLFDFDLTFPIEATLFIILAIVVTFVFIAPLSKQIDQRTKFIDENLRKSVVILTFGYEKLSQCVGLLTSEITEMNRQVKLVRDYTNEKFEEEISTVQAVNSDILSKLKGEVSIKSAFIFSELSSDLNTVTDKFFIKKFKSN